MKQQDAHRLSASLHVVVENRFLRQDVTSAAMAADPLGGSDMHRSMVSSSTTLPPSDDSAAQSDQQRWVCAKPGLPLPRLDADRIR